MFKLQSETRGEQTALIDEMIGNQKVVQAFSYEEEAMKRFDVINEKLSRYSLQAIFFSSTTNPATRFVNSLVYTGVCIVGALSVISGRITVGVLSCFLSYANQYTKPFNEISGVFTEFQNALACAARIFELIEETPQVEEPADARVLTHADGRVELTDVAFSYDPDRKLIEDLNLHVESGRRVAIVGPTGCGKSTLLNLIPRFYDVTEGRILLDGVDIRDISQHKLRSVLGLVPQKAVLFSGDIASNVKFAHEDISDEKMKKAAEIAQATEFIDSKPEKYESPISQGGTNVSGGQKQRLSIARAVAAEPKIFLFDDSFSALDYKTDVTLRKALAQNTADATVIIVAQRISTILHANRIIVLENGTIAGMGTHEELLANCPAYQEIAKSQLSEKELQGGAGA